MLDKNIELCQNSILFSNIVNYIIRFKENKDLLIPQVAVLAENLGALSPSQLLKRLIVNMDSAVDKKVPFD